MEEKKGRFENPAQKHWAGGTQGGVWVRKRTITHYLRDGGSEDCAVNENTNFENGGGGGGGGRGGVGGRSK